MESLIQTYLPNVYKMGWAGQAGWGTAIYLTLYMTVLSFIIGGFLGLVAGLFLVLTAPGGVLENKVVFWILDKITSTCVIVVLLGDDIRRLIESFSKELPV